MSKFAVDMVIICVIAGIIAWDIYLATDEIAGNTISARIRKRRKYLRFLVGYAMFDLYMHWFHQEHWYW